MEAMHILLTGRELDKWGTEIPRSSSPKVLHQVGIYLLVNRQHLTPAEEKHLFC